MDKLQKLKEVISTINESLSREEFVEAFRIVVDLVKKLQVSNKEYVDSLDSKYSSVVDDIAESLKYDTSSTLEDVKKTAVMFCGAELAKLIGKVDEKLATVRDGEDADVEQVAAEASRLAQEALKPTIPTMEQLSLEIPKLGAPIRDALELLPEGEKLKIEAIEHLREELDELRRLRTSGNLGGMGGAVGLQNAIKYHDLSGSLDGVLSSFPVPALGDIKLIVGSSFPFNYRKTVDYTYDASTNTLTFTSQIDPSVSLATGQTITILYS